METQKTTPLVSVIMPAYNAERFVEEAINSVISQTISDWELIVIDDCSTDNTYEILLSCAAGDSRIAVIQNEGNNGVAKTRNSGIARSRGAYIAFLDSDDVWDSSKLEKQLKQMERCCADIGYCSYEIIDSGGNKAKADYIVPETVTYTSLLKENVMQCSAMLIKADVVKKFLFNTKFYHEDYVLGLEMLHNGYVAVGCKDILLKWRYIENSRSFNKFRSAKNRWIIYRKFCQLSISTSLHLFAKYAYAGICKYSRKYTRS